ncbi:hypothetical protein PSD17_28350 [Pseudonocardia sp. D17]|nr:hypothetical protein PSD17_28350 [Pseudonocardia sp. D17]
MTHVSPGQLQKSFEYDMVAILRVIVDGMPTDSWSAADPDVVAFLHHLSEGAADAFAPTFLSTDPVGATVVTREALAAALPARAQLFARAGVGPLRLDEARQIVLDDRHLLVATSWQASSLRLDATYLLRREPAGLQVLVYLNHHDVRALLADRR